MVLKRTRCGQEMLIPLAMSEALVHVTCLKYCVAASLELRMQPQGDQRYRAAVPIVGRVIDPLIVHADMCNLEHRQRIIGLDDLLRTGMRQPAVTHEYAEAAGVQVTFARG